MTRSLLSFPRLSSLLACCALCAAASVRLPAAEEHGEAHGPPPAAAAVAPAAAPAKAEGDEIQGLLKLGPRLTDRGDYESAEIAYRQVMTRPGTKPADVKTAVLGLARMHRKQGALTKAAAIYEKYLKEYPGDERTPDALLELGRTMRQMGAYRLAIGRFYSVINSTLKLPSEGFEHYQQLAKTAQFEIAETHFQAGEFTEASKFFSRLRLLDLAPADRARAHFKAAYALSLQGDRDGATTMLRSFLEQFPTDENVPEARYLLAVNLRGLGRGDEAMRVTLDLLRVEQSQVASDAKRWAYWQRRTGNQLANDFFEHGDVLNAQAIYTSLAALSDDPAWRLPVMYQIALCNERLGAADRAHLTYQSIIDATKDHAIPEIADLGRMASWRLAHLDWSDTLHRQITTMFETTTGRVPPPSPPAPPASQP